MSAGVSASRTSKKYAATRKASSPHAGGGLELEAEQPAAQRGACYVADTRVLREPVHTCTEHASYIVASSVETEDLPITHGHAAATRGAARGGVPVTSS